MKKWIFTLVGIFLNAKIANLLQNTLETKNFSNAPGGAKNVFLRIAFPQLLSCAFDFGCTESQY